MSYTSTLFSNFIYALYFKYHKNTPQSSFEIKNLIRWIQNNKAPIIGNIIKTVIT